MGTETAENTATEPTRKGLSTADLAAVSENRERSGPVVGKPVVSADKAVASGNKPAGGDDEQLAPLFSPDVAKDFRGRWDAVQSGFVDDPRQAVRKGDELVAEVMKTLAETFSKERAKLEGQLDKEEAASTENLRVTLRHYRSFFKRLLSL